MEKLKCYFCGFESEDIVDEDFYDPITKHDILVSGCRHKFDCLQRQEERNEEWEQAMGIKE